MEIQFSKLEYGTTFLDTYSGEHFIKTGEFTAEIVTESKNYHVEDYFDPEEYVIV